MMLEEEYKQLIMKRDNLLKEKHINEEKIEKLNKLIDYYTWIYHSCLYEQNYYEENVLSYKKILNRPKSHNFFNFFLEIFYFV